LRRSPLASTGAPDAALGYRASRMTGFQREKEELCCDGVSLLRIAREVGTPVYVYSRALIEENFRRFDAAFAGSPHLICYAMKANGNLAIVRALGALGAGVDVVSGGELRAAMEAGVPADRIVFSGVGQTHQEIQLGAELKILAFNVESERELSKIDEIAGTLGRTARVALRVNPDIDSGSHPYIATGLKHNKFGIDVATARRLASDAARYAHVR